MASADDDHLCLRCNTHIKGLEAYVNHRNNDCREGGDTRKASGLEGDTQDDKSASYLIVDDQEVIKVLSAEDALESVSPSKGSRKRKANVPRSSPKKRSCIVKKKGGRGTPDRADGQVESGEETASPDSPRRSGRRGIRISYADLLSGADRSEQKVSPPGSDTRPDAKAKSARSKKESSVHQKGGSNDKSVKKKGNKGSPVVLQNTSSRRDPSRSKSPAAKRKNFQVIKGEDEEERAVILDEEVTKSSQKAEKKQRYRKERDEEKLEKENDEEKLEKENDDSTVEKDGGFEDDNQMEEVIYIKGGKFYCKLCDIYCLSKKKIDEHCATRKHARSRAKRSKENMEKDDNEDGSEVMECHACEYTTNNFGQFARHLRSIKHAGKTNIQLYACQKCHRKYKTEEELQTHQEFHETPRCRKCKETFESEELLEEHLDKEKHRIEYRCDVCNKVLGSKGSLKTHKRSHDPSLAFKCELCPYSAAQYNDVKKHMYRHSGYKPFKCSLCEYQSLTKSAVERHMKVHTVRSKDVQCDECDMTFYDVALLKQHKYMKHNPERKYPCPFEGCTYAYKYRSSLATHERMHTKEKPFLCAECGYATSTKHSLTKHMRLHTGEKPFHCDFPNCSYRSRLSTHLARHKIIHSGTKPFKCPLCKYACNNKQNLRKHILTTKAHAGIHMYKCKKCDDYSSNSFREYVVHIRKEHGGADEYINFFDVAEEFNKTSNEGEPTCTPELSIEKFVAEGDDTICEEELQTFSVVTLVPGRKGSKQLRKLSSLLESEVDVGKLEQVILSLENGAEVVTTETEGKGDDPEQLAASVQVDPMGNIISLTTEATGEHSEALVIIPEAETETEIQTSGGAEDATTVVTGDRGPHIQELVVEFDQSGRPVTEEEMAAATWLHNMGSTQSVSEETVSQEDVEEAAEDELSDEEQDGE